jgi:hypothetical protein
VADTSVVLLRCHKRRTACSIILCTYLVSVRLPIAILNRVAQYRSWLHAEFSSIVRTVGEPFTSAICFCTLSIPLVKILPSLLSTTTKADCFACSKQQLG